MANGILAQQMMITKASAAIAALETSKGVRTCEAHRDVVTGVVALLESDREQWKMRLTSSQEVAAAISSVRRRAVSWLVAGIIALAAAGLGVIIGRPDLISKLFHAL